VISMVKSPFVARNPNVKYEKRSKRVGVWIYGIIVNDLSGMIFLVYLHMVSLSSNLGWI
jgi:hypothetical protein